MCSLNNPHISYMHASPLHYGSQREIAPLYIGMVLFGQHPRHTHLASLCLCGYICTQSAIHFQLCDRDMEVLQNQLTGKLLNL